MSPLSGHIYKREQRAAVAAAVLWCALFCTVLFVDLLPAMQGMLAA